MKNSTKILSLLFTIIPFLSICFAFQDTHSTEVEFLTQKGIFSAEHKNFAPTKNLNRAEASKILVKALDLKFDTNLTKNCFHDVKTEWFAESVCALKQKNIPNSIFSEELFQPQKQISPHEFWTILTYLKPKISNQKQNFHRILARSNLSRINTAIIVYYTLFTETPDTFNIDFLKNSRAQIGLVNYYDSKYYSGGYPPKERGSCTDVIWQALKPLGYDFKKTIDRDVIKNPNIYGNKPDPNIDFRRVRVLRKFLERKAESLSIEIKPNATTTQKTWLPGDIVTYAQIPGGSWHIAVISDKKRTDGIPLIIHNYARGVVENDLLLDWPAKITGHYRLKTENLLK